MNQFVDALEVRTDSAGYPYYVGLSDNEEVLFTSESFDSRGNCLRACADLADDFIEPVEVRTAPRTPPKKAK